MTKIENPNIENIKIIAVTQNASHIFAASISYFLYLDFSIFSGNMYPANSSLRRKTRACLKNPLESLP